MDSTGLSCCVDTTPQEVLAAPFIHLAASFDRISHRVWRRKALVEDERNIRTKFVSLSEKLALTGLRHPYDCRRVYTR
jgi:hypothetical protein